jgi:hypothetical protein
MHVAKYSQHNRWPYSCLQALGASHMVLFVGHHMCQSDSVLAQHLSHVHANVLRST